jgi:hypothetical protein
MAELILKRWINTVHVNFQRMYIPLAGDTIYMILPSGEEVEMDSPVYAMMYSAEQKNTDKSGNVELLEGVIKLNINTQIHFGFQKKSFGHVGGVNYMHMSPREIARFRKEVGLAPFEKGSGGPDAKEEKGEEKMPVGPEEAAKFMSHDEQQEIKQLISNIDAYLKAHYNGEHIIVYDIPKKYNKLKMYARHKVIEEYRQAGWQDALWEAGGGKDAKHKFKLLSDKQIFKVNLPEGEFEKAGGKEHPEEPVDHQEALKERERRSKW